MKHKRSPISAKLWLLNFAIILSAILGIGGAYELKKGATLHELNTLHLKYNLIFFESVIEFKQTPQIDTSLLRQEVNDIRDQPVACLETINWLEEQFLKLIGTHAAIQVCEEDIELADDTLRALRNYEQGILSKDEILTQLSIAVQGFKKNSSDFEPLVKRSVSKLFSVVLFLVILKSILIVIFGGVMSRLISKDYSLLEKAENDVREANGELEEFAYRTSHDLRSPLISSISLLARTKAMIQEDKKRDAVESLEYAQTSLEKLEILVKDILTLTHTQKVEEDDEKIDVSALIDETLFKLSYMENFERLDIQKNYEPRTIIVTKKSRITLIIENLISNSIKYQNLNDKQSYVRISAFTDAKNFTLKVEDNGLGIPQKQHSKIFMMFKRFHSRVSFGSGLGLYMVKKSAGILGGQIVFESPLKGAAFILTVPLK